MYVRRGVNGSLNLTPRGCAHGRQLDPPDVVSALRGSGCRQTFSSSLAFFFVDEIA